MRAAYSVSRWRACRSASRALSISCKLAMRRGYSMRSRIDLSTAVFDAFAE